MQDEQRRALGSYQLLKSLGKGGQGEVFAAYDPHCARLVALKRMIPGKGRQQQAQLRFLREAKIAAQLSHPNIIPIYAIHASDPIYYTMPYIAGETLLQVVRTSLQQERQRLQPLHPLGASIPALANVLLTVCRALAYSYSQGILHRDLKGENIMIGKYGEVLILDWGLAGFVAERGDASALAPLAPDLTPPGRALGTLAYAAPERLCGQPATVSSEIYSLGVLLFEVLTLRRPFLHTSRQRLLQEKQEQPLPDPCQINPTRHVPLALAQIVKQCLAPCPGQRYGSFAALIADLTRFVEGKPDWKPLAALSLAKSDDWLLQEALPHVQHLALADIEQLQWFNLFLSKYTVSGNFRIDGCFCLQQGSSGFGILLAPATTALRDILQEGLLFAVDATGGRFVYRGIELARFAGQLEGGEHRLRIEKIEHRLYLFIDSQLHYQHYSQLPFCPLRIAVLMQEQTFALSPLQVATGSPSTMISCLAVGDALLARGHLAQAVVEYQRIAASLCSRREGRDALFRAGSCLLQQAQQRPSRRRHRVLLQRAYQQFDQLNDPASRPLQYLGKASVYQAAGDFAEERKCLELALRLARYHPLLLPRVEEHLGLRLYKCGRRQAAELALVALRVAPAFFANSAHQPFLQLLDKQLPPLFFLIAPAAADHSHLLLRLAFCLLQPLVLREQLEQSAASDLLRSNALFALLQLGCKRMVQRYLPAAPATSAVLSLTRIAAFSRRQCLPRAFAALLTTAGPPPLFLRTLDYLLQQAEESEQLAPAKRVLQQLLAAPGTAALHRTLSLRLLRIHLLDQETAAAAELFAALFPAPVAEAGLQLQACLLQLQGDKQGAAGVLRRLAARTRLQPHSLLAHFLQRSEEWQAGEIFFWERVLLYQQRLLYARCCRAPRLQREVHALLAKEKRSCQRQQQRRLRLRRYRRAENVPIH